MAGRNSAEKSRLNRTDFDAPASNPSDQWSAIAMETSAPASQFVRSSTLQCQGVKTDRLIDVLAKVAATHYISGPAAKDYMEQDKLTDAGITLEYMRYDYPDYPQLGADFDPHVSILDLLFMTGPNAAGYIWESAPVRRAA